jgi:hypothetical protein
MEQRISKETRINIGYDKNNGRNVTCHEHVEAFAVVVKVLMHEFDEAGRCIMSADGHEPIETGAEVRVYWRASIGLYNTEEM